MRGWIIGVLAVAVLAVAAIVWMYTVNTVRIPDEGDRYTYFDERGDQYVFTVTQKDPGAKTLAMKGESTSANFYDLELEFTYDGQWMEWTHMIASVRGETYTCDLKRGERSFLLFPVKRLLSRPKEFGFRALCSEEGAFSYQTRLTYGGVATIDTKGGSFRSVKITETVSWPLQTDKLGTIDLYVSPRLGFAARFDVTLAGEAGYGHSATSSYSFILARFEAARH
ncbi:MAG: hypothetical protein ACREJQ_08030 [bacterium]